jgi:DNA-binding NarL/FixJ family response regulator
VNDALRVVLGDDDLPSRAAVGEALERHGCEVVAEAASAASAVRATRDLRPDVTLLDVGLPGGGLVAALRIIRELHDAAVVVLAGSLRDDDVVAAFRAGASAYLDKEDLAELPQRLRRIVAGEAIFPRSLTGRIARELPA